MRRFGIVVLRLVVSLVFATLAILVAAVVSEVMLYRESTRLALLQVLTVSLVLPVWINVPMLHRFRAVLLGIGAGLATMWIASLTLDSGKLALGSLLQSSAMGISGVAAYYWLRAIRKRLNES